MHCLLKGILLGRNSSPFISMLKHCLLKLTHILAGNILPLVEGVSPAFFGENLQVGNGGLSQAGVCGFRCAVEVFCTLWRQQQTLRSSLEMCLDSDFIVLCKDHHAVGC